MELSRLLDTGVAVGLFAALVPLSAGAPRTTHLPQYALPLPGAVGLGAIVLTWPLIFLSFGLYDTRGWSRSVEASRIVAACLVGTVIVFAMQLVAGASAASIVEGAVFWAGVTCLTLMMRCSRWIVASAPGVRAVRRVLIVGSGPRAARVYRQLNDDAERESEIVGFVDSVDCGELDRLVPRLGTLDEVESVLMHHVVDEVLVALPIKSCYADIQRVIAACERMGTESRYLADLFQCTLARPCYDESGALPSVSMKVFYDDSRLVLKRILDFVGSLTALLLLAPLLLLTALAIKLSSPGPVIFTQERYGLNKRRFRMYKFRTMLAAAEQMQESLEALNEAKGAVFKIHNDPRITPLGRLLRKYSLDELPQLVNVLNGHMSLVGPRPLPIRDVSRFDEPWFMRRFSVRPGLTCLWQIRGRSTIGFDDWMALDLEYIDHWSLRLDFEILARTIPAVVTGTGAS